MEQTVIRTIADLRGALAEPRPAPERRLGEILIGAAVIGRDSLEEALRRQRLHRGRHLGTILVEMGRATVQQVNAALARKLGIPCVRFEGLEISPQVLSLVPPELALRHALVPLALIDGRLVVAMENPFDPRGAEIVRFNTKHDVAGVMAPARDIARALRRYYSAFDECAAAEEGGCGPRPGRPAAADARRVIEQGAKKKPIVRLLNAIISQAVMRRASDINIRPERDRVDVYYRIDGRLQHARALDAALLAPLVSRVKIIGRMDIAERRAPQEGAARLARGARTVDLRISVLPTIHGESVAIRILDRDHGLKSLDRLGLAPADRAALRRILSRPYGLFLVTGPTGSGKSTTLYALLEEVGAGNAHILTVEDPVEYTMDGVEQVQIFAKKGLTFAETLRRFLRHDPDVIMVGEIRDQETAAIANRAALTGHFVLSTLHTNDAPSAIGRLIDMGVEPYILGSTLLGVMSQRLLRLNCGRCRQVDGGAPQDGEGAAAQGQVFYRGAGCPACHFTGYAGRTLVSEILTVSPQISPLIHTARPAAEIARVAASQGMRRLADHALDLAREGRTSLEEVMALRLE